MKYKVIELNFDSRADRRDLESRLNEFAQQGWEIDRVLQQRSWFSTGVMLIVLKRSVASGG